MSLAYLYTSLPVFSSLPSVSRNLGPLLTRLAKMADAQVRFEKRRGELFGIILVSMNILESTL